MEIRTATEGDIAGIVELLKVSLGESLMPKSERYWRWKHLENPFGVSPVLIAIADNRIVGVRAFMRWAWTSGKKRIEAVRAVDTATHPEFQGKGVFSKLTKALLKDCEDKGIDLVYNTPNKSSLPGYLRMGWQLAGRYPVIIKPVRPLSMMANLVSGAMGESEVAPDNSVSDLLNHPDLGELLATARGVNDKFRTAHTVASLKWRYLTVPVAHYYACGLEMNGRLKVLFFYRLKWTKYGSELRVTDLFMTSDAEMSHARKLLVERIKLHRADYVTFDGLSTINLLRGVFSVKSPLLGPKVTIRQIGQTDISSFNAFKNWSPSLGDLELF